MALCLFLLTPSLPGARLLLQGFANGPSQARQEQDPSLGLSRVGPPWPLSLWPAARSVISVSAPEKLPAKAEAASCLSFVPPT